MPSVKQKSIALLRRLCSKVHLDAMDVQQDQTSGVYFISFFCEWDVTKKKKYSPPSIVPDSNMPSPAYELYFPLPIASCTVSYPPPLFMAEMFFKASKEF